MKKIDKSVKDHHKLKPYKIRIKLFFKINLLFLSLVIMAGCLAGMGIEKYFISKSGMTIMECYLSGKEAVKDSSVTDFKSDKATNIYSSSGKKISTIYKNKENTYLPYDEIPQYAIDAFVAVEDRTFWENDGIDLKGIARVIINYVKTRGRQSHGASTITQQLARQKYLTLDKTLSRKVAEIAVAKELSRKYSKEEIMEFYVNTCCFANGIYGLQDAALTYFGKDAVDLSLSQTAYLCAIPNWPEHYNPLKDADTAISRRDKILGDMLEMEYISQTQHDKAVNEEIKLYHAGKKEKYYDYETTYAIHCATEYLMEKSGFEFQYTYESDASYNKYREAYENAYNESKDKLYSGGYDIYTTIDLKIQKKMQKAVDDVLAPETKKLKNGIYKLQGALTAVDNETGKVIAVVGGRKQKGKNGLFALNRAYQGYAQPGSSIKPVAVYTPSMEETKKGIKFSPESVLRNIDVTYAKKATKKEISEMDGDGIEMRSAVRDSLNGCAYWLLNEIGIKRGVSHLAEMGFSRICPSDYTLSAALGGITYGVTTDEMANAYYTLANSGLYKNTDCIKSILDKDGNEIYKEPGQKRVYDVNAADSMTGMLKDVLKDGTAKSSMWETLTDTEAAGKTGTTNDNKAAWFCGYTPYYTIAVWTGCDKPVSVDGLTGASYPLSIWKDAMLELIHGKPAAAFTSLPAPEEDEEDSEYCICSNKCYEDSVNYDCPVCAGAGNDGLEWLCDGKDDTECICSYLCDSGEINETCPVCVKNPYNCKGMPKVSLHCICKDKCTKTHKNNSCAVCQPDWTECDGEDAGLMCICEWSCKQDGLDEKCAVCNDNIKNCTGKKHKKPAKTPKPDTPDPTNGPDETEGPVSGTGEDDKEEDGETDG